MLITPPCDEDLDGIVRLHAAYMRESYGRTSTITAEVLQRDGRGTCFHMLVARAVSSSGAAPVAFIAWEPAYDLHHFVRGGHVLDAYVERRFRGRGLAPAMIARVADEIRKAGGVFIKAQAVDPRPLRLYARVAATFPGSDCIVGGRAFRVLADLAGKDARAIARGLPEKEWNFEP